MTDSPETAEDRKVLSIATRDVYVPPPPVHEPDPARPDIATQDALARLKERVDTGELQGFAAVVWNARDRGFVHYLVLPPDPEVGPLRMVGDLELLKSDLLLLADGVDPSQPPEGFDDPDLDWVD